MALAPAPLAASLAAAALLLSGCGLFGGGEPIKAAVIADQIERQYVSGFPGSVVTCPTDIDAKEGTRTTCKLVTADSQTMNVFITVAEENADGTQALKFELGETAAASEADIAAAAAAKNSLDRDVLATQVQAQIAERYQVEPSSITVACFQDLPATVGASIRECSLYQGEKKTSLVITVTGVDTVTGRIAYDVTPAE